jgi:hypothetical protein
VKISGIYSYWCPLNGEWLSAYLGSLQLKNFYIKFNENPPIYSKVIGTKTQIPT